MIRRRLVALALLTCTITPVAITSAAPPPVTVDASFRQYVYYYSDATMTTHVGSGVTSCSGQYYLFWGQETSYFRVEQDPEPCGW